MHAQVNEIKSAKNEERTLVALSVLWHAYPYGLPLATEATYFISMTTCEGHQLMFQWIPEHCGLPKIITRMQQQR